MRNNLLACRARQYRELETRKVLTEALLSFRFECSSRPKEVKVSSVKSQVIKKTELDYCK